MLSELFGVYDLGGYEVWLPPVVGLIACSLALIVGHALWRESLGDFQSDPFELCSGERRQSPRRGGSPVEVLVGDVDGSAPVQGWVIDRSLEGLCLSMPQSVSPGEVLTVHRSTMSEHIAWVPLLVKHCRQQGNSWILGGQFSQSSPSSLPQFG